MNLPFRNRNTARHEMKLVADYELGGEWLCPDCGRRLVLGYKSAKMIVLERGDQNAAHAGATGDLKMSVNLKENDPRLKPFENFFDDTPTE